MSSRNIGAAAVAAVIALWAPLASAQSPATSTHPPYPWADQKLPPIVLHKHGVFWAGGQIVKRTQVGTEASGPLTVPIATQDYEVGQAYVEYFIPQHLRNGRKTIPIVMVPGGNLVGVHYLTTPDGREGWADFFIRRGFPVYIVDVPGRGRSGFSPDQFNNVRQGAAPPNTQPNLGTFDGAGWLEWNTGPSPMVHGPRDPNCFGNDARGVPPTYCNGDLMPATTIPQYRHWLAANLVAGPVPGSSNDGLIAVLQTVGPAIYIGHSAGGSSGGTIANDHPELFKGLIGLEPASDCLLTPAQPIKGLPQVPAISMHGATNQVGRPQTGPCVNRYKEITTMGGDATYLSFANIPDSVLTRIGVSAADIPQCGIWGTDHIMMWDNVSDDIAGIMLDWIEKHVERKNQQNQSRGGSQQLRGCR
jgi:pimeloyl-ACP methyl ester carboxylesterase